MVYKNLPTINVSKRGFAIATKNNGKQNNFKLTALLKTLLSNLEKHKLLIMMNKKFASLGTAISRDEAKKVMGGEGETSKLFGCSISYSCYGNTPGISATVSCNGAKSCSFEFGSAAAGNMTICGVVCDGVEMVCPGWE